MSRSLVGIGVAPCFAFAAALALGAAGCGEEAGAEAAAASTSAATARAQGRSSALTQDEVCLDGDPSCLPTGAHAKHSTYACTICHKVAGRLVFDKNSGAYGAGLAAPTFDATAKTCSNIGCHTVPSGSFTYSSWDWGLDQPVNVTVPYGGTVDKAVLSGTPSWYSTSSTGACGACHGNPPQDGYAWHSGYHGNLNSSYNSCTLCHNDALTTTSNGVYVGYAINSTYASSHANGTVNVTPTWGSQCFGCH